MSEQKKIITDFQPILDFIKKYDNSRDQNNLSGKLDKLKKDKRVYSDVKSIDPVTNEELQYVDFVQEGGGTLGVALVGYTFVLEYMGIRFLKLAGTSAGAINTIFLAAIGDKHEPKSPELFDILTGKDFDLFKFVDGNSFAKFMIKSIIGKDGLFTQLVTFFIIIAALALIVLPLMNLISIESVGLYIFSLILFVALIFFTIYQLSRFNKANFGINPGRYFLTDFLKERLKDYGINNSIDLSSKAEFRDNDQIDLATNNKLGLYYDPGNCIYENKDMPEIIENYRSNNKMSINYSFVTADINNQLKVSFPQDAKLYWLNPEEVHPAEYVRASMAIPIFFEPYFSDPDKGTIKPQILEEWKKEGFDTRYVANYGIFIDGGSISNFPINKLHNPNIILPRVPVFGSRLADSKSKKPENMKSIFDYGGRIINTIRGQEDKSFLRKYNFYQKYSISEIEAYNTKISWLNFNLSEKDKAALFLEGVKTGLKFLEEFDWCKYKNERVKLYQAENGNKI